MVHISRVNLEEHGTKVETVWYRTVYKKCVQQDFKFTLVYCSHNLYNLLFTFDTSNYDSVWLKNQNLKYRRFKSQYRFQRYTLLENRDLSRVIRFFEKVSEFWFVKTIDYLDRRRLTHSQTSLAAIVSSDQRKGKHHFLEKV